MKMEEKSGDVPLPPAQPLVGIIYNCKRNTGGEIPDAEAEYDSMSGEDADIAGDVVTHSDFTGVYSHGMSRLALYLRLFGTGAYNPRPNIKVLKDEGSVIHLDCDNALGVVTVNKAFDRLLPRAKESGIAICIGRRSSNIGCASYYGWRAAKNDVICLVCCNTYLSMEDAALYEVWKRDEIEYEFDVPEDSRLLLTGYGTSGRIAKSAVKLLRGEGYKVGFIRPLKVNPFPAEAFERLDYATLKGILVAEMSIPAQYGEDVRLHAPPGLFVSPPPVPRSTTAPVPVRSRRGTSSRWLWP